MPAILTAAAYHGGSPPPALFQRLYAFAHQRVSSPPRKSQRLYEEIAALDGVLNDDRRSESARGLHPIRRHHGSARM
jgi:hypothetical protein